MSSHERSHDRRAGDPEPDERRVDDADPRDEPRADDDTDPDDTDPGDTDPHDEPRCDDDTDVERYRDSPGIGLFSDGDPPEPNEPG